LTPPPKNIDANANKNIIIVIIKHHKSSPSTAYDTARRNAA